jgi:hypothetical protein
MIFRATMRRGTGIAALALCATLAWADDAVPLFATDVGDTLDVAACRLFVDGSPPQAVGIEVLRTVLGTERSGSGWSVPEGAAGSAQHVIAWKQPRPVGSVLALDADQIAVLRSGAAWPPDANDATAWEPLMVLGRSVTGARLASAEAVRTTSAIRITRKAHKYTPLRSVFVAASRLRNAASDAVAHADTEYTVKPQMSSPYTLTVAGLLAGSQRWQNTGPDSDGHVARAMISEESPSWIILSWPESRPVHALWMEGNATALRISSFVGPEGVHPVAGLRSEWQLQTGRRREGHAGSLLRFAAPVSTRALRIEIERVSPVEGSEAIAQLTGLIALDRLGDAPLPAAVDAVEAVSPLAVPVEVTATGTVSVVIDAADGRRVRNLTARQPATPGLVRVPWDLKDEDGRFQGEGQYRWTALSVPTLSLSYELSPYPNVEMNSDNPPWLCGQSGPGGWMADHSAPRAVCAAGDWVFFGSPCAESGVALAACDLEGRKVWGHHNFMAWTGPSYITTDGKVLYVGAASPDADRVWSVACDGGKSAMHLQSAPTSGRLRGMRGLAATSDRLFVSVAANGADVFARAAAPGDIEFAATVPFCRPKPANTTDRDPVDERSDLARLFRLAGTPPGNSKGLTTIESTDMPALRQHVVLAFKRPVDLGALAFPMPGGQELLRLAVLKPDAAWPPDAKRETDWSEFHRGKESGWTVLPLPPSTSTRALRITFDRAEDEFDDVLDATGELDIDNEAMGVAVATTSRHASWKGRLEGMALLRNRLAALPDKPEVRVSSGKVAPDGSWDAQRDRPLTEDDPGVYTMVWAKPQTVRGLAIQEIDGKRTEIDVYVGSADGPLDLADDRKWESAAHYEQPLRYYYQPDPNHNSRARYMDGYVDFGRDLVTRAIRLRVVEPWLVREEGRKGCVGVRNDRGGQVIDATRCRIYGIVAVRNLAAEGASDVLRTDRIEVYAAAKLVSEWPLERPGPLALDRSGKVLYAVSGRRVAAVDTATGVAAPLEIDVLHPDGLAVDGAGLLYVYDRDRERLNVRVCDPKKGTLVRTIGTPGGHRAGPWDPTCFTTGPRVSVALAVASNDRLWVVENDFAGKRSSRWTLDGTFEKELVGTPRYGGGGCLDPWDKRRLYYEDGGATLVFDLDWRTGATRPIAMAGLGKHGGGVLPVRRDGHHYLVTRTLFGRQSCGRVFVMTNDVARLVAAVGAADAFPELRTREILSKLGQESLDAFSFTWSDRNADSAVQESEVVMLPTDGRSVGQFDRELGVHSATRRYAVASIAPDGTPSYEVQELRGGLAGAGLGAFRLPDGKTIAMGPPLAGHGGYGAESELLWRWRTEGFGVHAYYSAGPYAPAQVTAEFDLIGAEQVEGGGLGTFYATSSNTGTWHLWSGDGILFGRLFQDLRERGRLSWSMPEHNRGLDVSRVTLSQEHFSGYLCRTFEDNRYYVVAGHSHISVAAIGGLEEIRRQTGVLTVDAATVRKVAARIADDARTSLYKRAPVMRSHRVAKMIGVDGVLDDWPVAADATLVDGNAEFRLGYDEQNLYAAWTVRECGPFANRGNDWRRLYKTGAIVDLFVATDPAADPRRRDAVRGDQRILIAPFEGQPVAVLYRPVDADAAEGEAWETHTEVFAATFDRVRRLDKVRVASRPLPGGQNGYIVEAAIPLFDLGLKLTDETRVRFDWGVQEVGADGNAVLQRLYWANHATRIISDEAAEAAFHPEQWGDLLFVGQRTLAAGRPVNALDADTTTRDLDKLMEDALGD